MKPLPFLLSILILMCCTHNPNNENQNTKALDNTWGKKLIETGFLEYADSLRIDSLKIEIIESFQIYNEDHYKLVHIDAEALSEFNFDFFLPQLNNLLSKRDLKLEIALTNDYERSKEIQINGQKVKLYTHNELEAGTFWDSAPRNFFKEVNALLQKHNKAERFYLLYAGNNLHAFLLTENQFKIIAKRYQNEKMEIPYLP